VAILTFRAAGRDRVAPVLATLATAAAVWVLEVKAAHVGMQLAGGLVAAALLRWVSLHVRAGLVVILLFVPVQQPVLAYLYAHGLPLVLAKDLGYLKELVVAGVVVAAVQAHPKASWRLQLVDRLVLVYIALVVLFFLVPVLVPSALGGQPLATRAFTLRLDCLFLVLFFAARRLAWSARDLQVLAVAAVGAGALMVVAVLWEKYANDGFVHFSVQTLGLPAFQRDAFGLMPADAFSASRRTTGELRVGGWLYDPLSLGFFLVLPLAITFRGQAERRAQLTWALTGLLAVSLVFTVTRSSILAGVLAIALVLVHTKRLQVRGRTQLLVVTSSLVDRLSSALNGTDASAQGHSRGSSKALTFVLRHPGGYGLGTQPAVEGLGGTDLTSGISAENAYLQIGVELGVVPMLLFVFLVLANQAELRRASVRHPSETAITGVWAAGWGLALNGLFLDVWLSFPVSLSFWVLAGVAGVAGQDNGRSDQRLGAASTTREPVLVNDVVV
jgi:hypothetical protein